MKSPKIEKNKLFAGAVVAILIVFFIGGFLIGLDRVRSMEGTYPEPVNAEGELAPANIASALEQLDKLIKNAEENDPKLSVGNSFSLSKDSLKTTGSDEFKSTLILAKDNFEDHIVEMGKDSSVASSTNYGESFSEIFRYPNITEKDVESISDNMVVFRCISCGNEIAKDDENTTPPSNCELCGSEREYFVKYRDEITVNIVLKCEAFLAENSVLKRNFAPRTTEEIAALTADVLSDSASVKVDAESDILYNTLLISYTFNRITNELKTVQYVKGMTVNATIDFKGDYEALATQDISFDLNEVVKYNFTWPGIALSSSSLVIEPGNSNNLLATLTCDDPVSYSETVIWTSSDENMATVDEDGYIDAKKTTGDVTITAEFTYLGVVYSDACTVHIRVPVESVKMVTKKVNIGVGESKELNVKLSPSDATDKSVRWHSEDESIAVVDENGVVTGVSAGEVIVFAVTNDGNYKSTCEVSVK